MTKLEIFREIIGYYIVDPKNRRSLTPHQHTGELICVYNGPDGKHCAFARVLIDPSKASEGFIASATIREHNTLLWEFGVYGEIPKPGLLKPQYDGHKSSFWNRVQLFHDKNENWIETGLSEIGQEKYDSLIEEFEEDGNEKTEQA